MPADWLILNIMKHSAKTMCLTAVAATALATLWCLPACAATIYKSIDANGVVQFSDTRPTDETVVETLEIEETVTAPAEQAQQRLQDMRETTDRMVATAWRGRNIARSCASSKRKPIPDRTSRIPRTITIHPGLPGLLRLSRQAAVASLRPHHHGRNTQSSTHPAPTSGETRNRYAAAAGNDYRHHSFARVTIRKCGKRSSDSQSRAIKHWCRIKKMAGVATAGHACCRPARVVQYG